MDREKHIEEMARDMCGLGRDCHGCTSSMSYVCKAKKYAERAVDKGYRKQSEVAREAIDVLCELHDHFKSVGDIREAFAMLFAIAELKKKYTEEQK